MVLIYGLSSQNIKPINNILENKWLFLLKKKKKKKKEKEISYACLAFALMMFAKGVGNEVFTPLRYMKC